MSPTELYTRRLYSGCNLVSQRQDAVCRRAPVLAGGGTPELPAAFLQGRSVSHGAACELERLSEAVVGLLRGGPVFRDLHQTTASASTSSIRKPAIGSEIQRGGCRNRRPGPAGRPDQGLRDRERTTTSWSKRRSSTRSRSKAPIRSISSHSFRARKWMRLYLDKSYYIVPNDKVAMRLSRSSAKR